MDSLTRVLIEEDGIAEYIPSVLDGAEAQRVFSALLAQIPWRGEEVFMFGRWVSVPRQTCWFGDAQAVYRYSGVTHEPVPWLPLLLELRSLVQATAGVIFNSVLANLYRDGCDGMGWHADNEPELGADPTIASLSLGAARLFSLQNRKTKRKINVILESGSLLIMRGAFQHHWRHSLPKTTQIVTSRINLTFRYVHPAAPR